MGRRSLFVSAPALFRAELFLAALVAAVPAAAGQSASLRTPWGHPDLQGVWTGSTMTPLQRPAQLAGKEFLTPEEVAKMETSAEANRFVERVPQPGEPGTYNQVWFDPSTRVLPDRRTSLIVDPKDGRIPFKADALKHNTESSERYGVGPYDDWTSPDTGERCLTDGVPIPYYSGYNNNVHIFQTPQHVVIVGEMYGNRRVIPVAGQSQANVPQWMGQARGRWEGDTLVVESTNFADKGHYWWASSWRSARPSLRLVERFRRVDAKTIDYQFTMEDPEMFTLPWTAKFPLQEQAATGVTAGRLYEYACHEGNHAMTNILSGARSDEAKAAGK